MRIYCGDSVFRTGRFNFFIPVDLCTIFFEGKILIMKAVCACDMSLRSPGSSYEFSSRNKENIIIDCNFFLVKNDLAGKRKSAFVLFKNHFTFKTGNDPMSKTETQNSKTHMSDWSVFQIGMPAQISLYLNTVISHTNIPTVWKPVVCPDFSMGEK